MKQYLISTKNWLGNYNTTLVNITNEQHLSNYLNKINSSSTSKLIGVTEYTR